MTKRVNMTAPRYPPTEMVPTLDEHVSTELAAVTEPVPLTLEVKTEAASLPVDAGPARFRHDDGATTRSIGSTTSISSGATLLKFAGKTPLPEKSRSLPRSN